MQVWLAVFCVVALFFMSVFLGLSFPSGEFIRLFTVY